MKSKTLIPVPEIQKTLMLLVRKSCNQHFIENMGLFFRDYITKLVYNERNLKNEQYYEKLRL